MTVEATGVKVAHVQFSRTQERHECPSCKCETTIVVSLFDSDVFEEAPEARETESSVAVRSSITEVVIAWMQSRGFQTFTVLDNDSEDWRAFRYDNGVWTDPDERKLAEWVLPF